MAWAVTAQLEAHPEQTALIQLYDRPCDFDLQLDQTYYVIDMVCWRGYSLYDCTAEFRFFWLNSKLAESGACDAPSHYHKYRFNLVPAYNCDHNGLYAAYTEAAPYVKDGLLFYNK